MAKRKKVRRARRRPGQLLGLLLGTWRVEVEFPGQLDYRPLVGSARFRWLVKDALMVVSTRVPGGPPASICVLGTDDTNKEFVMLYSDTRRVAREYWMTLTREKWTLERDAPRFYQRFEGKFTPGRRKIHGTWQKSTNGRRWEHDFKITYIKGR